MNVRIQLEKQVMVKHQSLSHDAIRQKVTSRRAIDVEEAVAWCKENGCRGQKALASGLFPTISCPKTINRRLDGKVVTGEEKRYCSLLTSEEENSLVRYIKNRTRCLQGMNGKQVEEVVLRILRTREKINKKGGRSFIALSTAAKTALRKKKVSRSFFLRLRTKYPSLKMKVPKKVDINRGFNVTKEMAVEYLDDLAAEINLTGIGQLEYAGPGVWNGPIDTRRIVVHDETPQMINHGDSSYTTTKVFGVAGESCETLVKSNRECVTVHPFSNVAGETLCTQVIFSGAGLTSQMSPESTRNIPNLLVSVNKCGVSEHESLLDAYKELDHVLTQEDIPRPVIIVADGHSSRFDENVLSFLQAALLVLFILHADTSGGTQVHDQMNAKLHSLYDEKKELLYSSISTLNRESFMNILSEAWPEFAAPSVLVNAARRVGLSNEGLNITWMNQEMFKRADYLLNGAVSPAKTSSTTSAVVSSPVGVRKNTKEYFKIKFEATHRKLQEVVNTSISLEDVDDLLPSKKIQPKKSKAIRLTQVHGSMRAHDMLTKVKERNAAENAKLQKKNDAATHREKMRLAFILCKEKCQCSTSPSCIISGLKQCPVCLDVFKSQCSKSSCIIDGKKPVMVAAPSAPSAVPKQASNREAKRAAKRAFKDMAYGDDEDEEDDDDEEAEEVVHSKETESEEESGLSEMSDDEEEDRSEEVSVECNRNADENTNELLVSDDPMNYDDVLSGMWVVVWYEGERFLGNVDSKVDGDIYVRCLDKPFGVRTPQSYERGRITCWKEVYETNAIPEVTQIDCDGKKTRKWMFKY